MNVRLFMKKNIFFEEKKDNPFELSLKYEEDKILMLFLKRQFYLE